MHKSLIPQELLLKSDKILFITHLAIGDFVYLHNFFKELSVKYPNLKIDIWVDETRRTFRFWRWNNLKQNSLYEWLGSCSFFNKIYDQTHSPVVFRKSLIKAKKENYPIVVSFVFFRFHKYAKLARVVSPNGFVVGSYKPVSKFCLFKKNIYKQLVSTIDIGKYNKKHAVHTNFCFFQKVFGLVLKERRLFPTIDIPRDWIIQAKLKFLKLELLKNQIGCAKVIFINAFAKTKKRCWSMEKLMMFIVELRKDDDFFNAVFVINAPPGQVGKVKKLLRNYSSNRNFLFTADKNFFQLPAIISLCDLVISVETSVIHLAAALKRPTIALMRQKNPESLPYNFDKKFVIWCDKRNDWIKNIEIASVLSKSKEFIKKRTSNFN